MAIADDWTIDVVDRKLTYGGGFTDGVADSRYTMKAFYQFLMDTFDEPGYMKDPTPMTAQTPTQYSMENQWFIDDESVKALFSGSLQSTDWTYGSSSGITQHWWTDASSDPPVAGDIGKDVIVGATSKTGTILAVDTTRQIVWIRNTGATQFVAGDNVVEDGGATVDYNIEADDQAQQGVRSGESVWTNLYSVGNIQADTEIYVGQEDEWHGGSTIPKLEKLTSWWDSDTDFTASLNGVAAGHFDILVKVQDAGVWLDDLNLTSQGRLAVFARQGDTVYSHFELAAAVGNQVVPFASVGFDSNQEGFYRIGVASVWAPDFVVGEIITGATSGAKGRITALVTDTSLDYVLVGKNLTQFQTATEVINGETSGASESKDGSAPTLINGAAAALGITVTDGHNAVDVDEDSTAENYAITIDCNSNALSLVYQHVMYLCRRGSTTTLLPEPDTGNEDMEFYRGAGDVYLTTSAESVALTEGLLATGGTSGATGEIVAYNFSGTGYIVLTNVKGTFQAETITDSGTGSVTADAPGSKANFVDNAGAPFGTFAGGQWVLARGVVLTNVLAADNNNWSTSDVADDPFSPPTTILLTFAGLAVNDRAAILEVATEGGIDVVNTVVGVGAASPGATSITLDATVQSDVPSAGWIRVKDTSATDGTEWRYEYSSVSGTTVTLRTVSPGDDVADAGGTGGTQLVDVNVGLNFGTDGNAKNGHMIRNTGDSSEAIILRRISDNEIETTQLTGGTLNTWATGNAYEINTVAFSVAADDTAYFPYIDDTVQTGTSLANSLKYAADTWIVVRARFSDPDWGGTRIEPFELLGQQITEADLTVTAIRNTDLIAT
jgi:hypothetical protein